MQSLLVVPTAVLISVVLGAGLALLWKNPATVLVVIATGITVPLLWRRPVLGIYFLMAGAVLFESFPLNYPDSLTDKVPFFRSVASLGGPVPIPLNMAELLMFGLLSAVLLRRMVQRRAPLMLGTLGWPLAALAAALAGGVVHGLLTGGSFSVMVWELRGMAYLALTYLLAVNLVTSPGQLRVVFWVALASVGLKGLLGSWRYLVTLEGDLSRTTTLSTTNSLMAHEESYFFALFLIFVAAAWLLRIRGRQVLFAAFLVPPVVLAFLANERRAGILALFLGLIVVALMVYVTTSERRKVLTLLAVAALVVFPLYVVALSNDERLLAEPAAAITSAYQPGERDLSSNRYRSLENDNLLFNIMQRPIWGHGFGKPIPLLMPVPDLSDIWTLWSYIPHNTVLWVWYRAGFLGFVAFWVVVGRVLLGGVFAAKGTQDPYLRTVAIVTIAAVVAWVAVGLLDMGLTNLRSTAVVGTLVGLVAVIPRFEAQGPKLALTESDAG